MFYSKSTNGFYSTEIHGDKIPSDAIEITIEKHAALIHAQCSGKLIQADADGNPITSDPIPKTAEELRERIEVTAFQAQAALARSGKYDAILKIMESTDTPLEMKLAWNKAQSFKRLSPTVLAMAQLLQLSESQLDDLFALAKTIEA